MKSISDLIFSKLISFEPNINPVPREEIIDFFTKEQRFIREDHIKFLMEYGGEPLPICFKEAYITCSFKEIKELIDDEKEYGKEIPDGFSYFGSFFPEEPIIINNDDGALYRVSGNSTIGEEICGNIKTFVWFASLYYLNKISRQISKKTNLSNNYIDDFLFINNSYLLSDLQSIGMRYFLISNILHCVSIEDNYILSHEINQEVMTYINKSTS